MDPSTVGFSANIAVQYLIPILIASTVFFVLVAGYFYYKNLFNYWPSRGVKGPKPIPIFGNALTILLTNQIELEKEWVKKYGKVYGIFIGGSPRLVIADAELMNKICIKDFDVFTNHETNEFFNEFQKSFIFSAQDEDWKRIRALTSPTFTSGKIKRMFRLLDRCADDLIQCFDEQLSKTSDGKEEKGVANAKDTFGLYALDAISTCCYGLKMERCGAFSIKMAAKNNELVRLVLGLFKFNYFRMLIGFAGPKSLLRLFKFEFFPRSIIMPLANQMTKVIDARHKSKAAKFDDYLQMLIESRIDNELELNEMDLKENHHAGLTPEYLIEEQRKMVKELEAHKLHSKAKLTDMEVLTGAIFLMVVGLNTTSSLLNHCLYALAFHADIQQRLYDELEAIANWDETKKRWTFDYDSITSCQYLDAVVSETLRLLTPVLLTDRVAKRDYLVEKYNILIPKGSSSFIALNAIHNDQDYWRQPEKFDPERFMPSNRGEIVSGAYCPFGIGPRHCVGMRFSLTSSKLALAKVLINFRFESAPKTVFPPKWIRRFGFIEIANPKVLTIKRDQPVLV